MSRDSARGAEPQQRVAEDVRVLVRVGHATWRTTRTTAKLRARTQGR